MSKNRQVEQHPTIKLLHSKGNQEWAKESVINRGTYNSREKTT